MQKEMNLAAVHRNADRTEEKQHSPHGETEGDFGVDQSPKPANTINNGEDYFRDENSTRSPMKFAYASGDRPLDGYTIKRGIGAGGFGDVYYAVSDAGKEVALKRIQRNLDVELRGVRQCLNLKHPNLVALYDIRFDEESQAWVVMEYVSGESLLDVIDRNPNGMPLEQVAHWFNGIAAGLRYLHDNGIVHRDIKPGNLFLDHHMVKIGDYGLAKFISCSRRSGQTESVGTFHYMAPEIGLGRYGKEIDIYALGVLLYEMLTGKVPFDGESSQEIIMKHLTSHPKLDNLPGPYRSVIATALLKDPQQRYRDVDEMVAAVNGAIHGAASQPVVATAIGAGESTADTEEPIAKAAKQFFSELSDKFKTAPFFLRVVIAVPAVIMLMAGFEFLIILAVAYGLYYIGWSVYQAGRKSTQPRFEPAATVAYPLHGHRQAMDAKVVPNRVRRPKRIVTKQQLHGELEKKLHGKTFSLRTTELVGSMIFAALVAAVVSIGGAFLLPSPQTSWMAWAPSYAWLAVTSTVGSWMVLGLAKWWEGSGGDGAIRRFFMLMAGLALGAFSYFLSTSLMLHPHYLLSEVDGIHNVFVNRTPLFYRPDGAPKLFASMVYFGALLTVSRWWLRANPLRGARIGIVSTTLAVVLAIAIHAAMPIPKGFLVAAVMAVSVQLAAPWVNHSYRREVRGQLQDQNG